MPNKTSSELSIAHPEMVLRAAEEEPARRLLDDYIGAIQALREKNFTFREIAEWLERFGLETDHNAVWRAYAKTVPELEAHEEAEADEALEREEAIQAASVEGSTTTMIARPSDVKRAAVTTALETRPSKKKMPGKQRRAVKKSRR